MKALKIIGTLAAVGGAYFLLSSDDQKKEEEEKKQESTANQTSANNATNSTQADITNNNLMAAKLPINPIKEPKISADSKLLMTPTKEQSQINPTEEHLPKISADGKLPMIPIEEPIELKPINSSQKPATAIKPIPINLVNQLPAEPGTFVMTPIDDFIIDVSKDLKVTPEHQSINYTLSLLEDFPDIITTFPITKGDSGKFRFKAIESKKGGVVPIVIYSLKEKPQTYDIMILFSETREQLTIGDFLPLQGKRLKEKELSLLIAISFYEPIPKSILDEIKGFIFFLSNVSEVETLVLQ